MERRRGVWGWLALLAALSGCAAPYRREEATAAAWAPELAGLEAPGRPTDWEELKRLGAAPAGPPALLRRAFLFLRVDRPERAREVLDEALLRPDLSPEGRAVAYFGKARAFALLGLPERAAWSRDRARELTRDARLRVRLAELGDLAARAAPAPPAGEGEAAGEGGLFAGLGVRARSEWGARPTDLGRVDPMERIWRITVHHSAIACPDGATAAVAAQIRAIQRSHQGGEQWADVGYHFFIDPAGRIWEGRPLRYQGAHAGSRTLNAGNVGVCLLGDFSTATPPAPQAAALERLVRALAARFRVAGKHIYGHRDLKGTICPGGGAYPLVERLRRVLAANPAP